MSRRLILASASPRRQQILAELGVEFSIKSADIDEAVLVGELAENYVTRLAVQKAQTVFKKSAKDVVVLGADTCVVIEGRILGKPTSQVDSRQMLLSLAGKWHQVYTAVAMVSASKTKHILLRSEVEFSDVDQQMCDAYWRSGEPADKAGSYAIQGKGARFVRQIRGSYSSIVGLPVSETASLLEEFDIATWNF